MLWLLPRPLSQARINIHWHTPKRGLYVDKGYCIRGKAYIAPQKEREATILKEETITYCSNESVLHPGQGPCNNHIILFSCQGHVWTTHDSVPMGSLKDFGLDDWIGARQNILLYLQSFEGRGRDCHNDAYIARGLIWKRTCRHRFHYANLSICPRQAEKLLKAPKTWKGRLVCNRFIHFVHVPSLPPFHVGNSSEVLYPPV